MADLTDVPSTLASPLTSHPSDVMNDPTFDPPPRRNTASSLISDKVGDTCRICRSEGTSSEPLFYPCKCSGSIKYVHQECLMEWLEHSHKKHCELCKTPFRFTKLYDAEMPETLPWMVFVRRACLHFVWMLGRLGRGCLVFAVWAIVLPWLVRWAWRWIFWLADAGWAREAFMGRLREEDARSGLMEPLNETTFSLSGISEKLGRNISPNATYNAANGTAPGPAAYQFAKDLAKSLGLTSTSNTNTSAAYPGADTSILSSWTYLSDLTPFPRFNRVILDICEGQLITCVVITGFILVFLIREWVVQQQPLVNLDNLNDVQQQLVEAAQRVAAENARLRRQQELLEQARRRLLELQDESREGKELAGGEVEEEGEFGGWEGLNSLIDHATEHLRKESEEEKAKFKFCAHAVVKQIRLSGPDNGMPTDELAEKIGAKLETFSVDERMEWEMLLLGELEKMGTTAKANADRAKRAQSRPGWSRSMTSDLIELRRAEVESSVENAVDADGVRRPRMPDRDFSSRATQIQRLLEEAEGIFSPQEVAAARAAVRNQSTTASTSENASVTSAPSSAESWQHVTPPSGAYKAIEAAQSEQQVGLDLDELPITNAGPDAKVNIKRSGKGKARAVPEPKEVLPADAKKRQEEDEAMKKLEEEIKAEDSATGAALLGGKGSGEDLPAIEPAGGQQQTDNPFHPEGPEPEPRQSGSVGGEIASELMAVDAPEYDEVVRQRLEEHRRTQVARTEGHTDFPATPDEEAEEQPQQRPPEPPSYIQRLADWFWADIKLPGAHEAAPAPDEERVVDGDNVEQEAPFVPVTNGRPGLSPADVEADQPYDHPPNEHAHDPEVLAAAQQAGLDADAVEEAEDLEGILELIGLQGPLLGLFQTSTFCTVLVTGTVFGAVGLPYIWGKLVLNLIGSPMYFLVKMPLLVAGFMADFVVDVTLFVAGWAAVGGTLVMDVVLRGCQTWIKSLEGVRIAGWVAEFAKTTATKSGTRLAHLFLTTKTVEKEIMGWNWAFLGASVHAHASLRQVQEEIAAVLDWMGHGVTTVVETISSGTLSSAWRSGLQAPSHVSDIPANLSSGLQALKELTYPLLQYFDLLKTGSLSFETPTIPMDPSLVYWSTTDRILAVIAGYVSLALLAAIYVALDTPITRSEAGRKTEKQIRDTLRQAGGVLKVILIISIEMLVFPFYCGLLLDLAFLPLFQGASMASRWAFAGSMPYTFCFVHWFVGTCYMFHFALFVGMCRKILRKGVLWFIRDPDDPTFHPVRDVLERNVTTQLRKIAFSALVYGALVILCLGGVIWTIGKVFKGIFPIYWVSTEPVLEFPMDLLLYNAVAPLIVRLVKPSDAVNAMYAWWLRRCARVLRLSHFLFDDRRKDEEGRYVRKSWSSSLLMRKSTDVEATDAATTPSITQQAEEAEVHFSRDGKYVLTPCSDQYRPPKPDEAFLHYDDASDDVYVADKDGKRNEQFAKVYVPPFFRLRVTLFMVCLWMFSAFTGLCVTLVPLVFGRRIFANMLPEGMRVNDIYAYSTGAYILGGLLFVLLQGRPAVRYLRERTLWVDLRTWTAPAKRYAMQAVNCAYVYGFIGVALPLIFALLLQFYFIMPLHTYVVSQAAAETPSPSEAATSVAANLTNMAFEATPFNYTNPIAPSPQAKLPTLAQHTIHILQDYCLGLLYVRIFSRLVIFTPGTRAHEAFHRILLDPGYLNPNARLATRFLIAPITLLAAVAMLVPPVTATLAIAVLNARASIASVLDAEAQTKMYRYSYPVAAAFVVLLLCTSEVGGATSRWRAGIKDEVYLVGERLHNFGEKKPPVGSRSILRKDR